jgi:hypothetical protein
MKRSNENQVDAISHRDEFEELIEMEIQDVDFDARVDDIMNNRMEAGEVLGRLDQLTEENKRLKQLLKDNGIEI